MKNMTIETNQILPRTLAALINSYEDGIGINRTERHDAPNYRVVRKILTRLFDVIFPGFSESGHPVTVDNLSYHIGDLLNHINLELSNEIERALRYDCHQNLRDDCRAGLRAQHVVCEFISRLPAIRELLKTDVQAGFDGDPAAGSVDEIIVSYPAIKAIATHRLAHELYMRGVPLLPRMWSECAHSETGIDINPGAQIGDSFFIDHGSGTVIGETCIIGKHVQIYQGVTLGALSPADGQRIRGKKRHPTIEDNVVIYANATILGGETVIGHDSTIGGNVWLTNSVDPFTRVVLPKADLVFSQQVEEERAVAKHSHRTHCVEC